MASSGPSGDDGTTSFDVNAMMEKIRKEKEEQMRKYGRHLTREEEFEMERNRLNNEMQRVIMSSDLEDDRSKKGCCCVM